MFWRCVSQSSGVAHPYWLTVAVAMMNEYFALNFSLLVVCPSGGCAWSALGEPSHIDE